MTNSAIWVLVANEDGASLYESNEGVSRPVKTFKPEPAPYGRAEECRYDFAWQLMSELFYGAQADCYSGVILLAAPVMLTELRRVMMPSVRKLVVGEIARPAAARPIFETAPAALRVGSL